jgi:hypothetical protein
VFCVLSITYILFDLPAIEASRNIQSSVKEMCVAVVGSRELRSSLVIFPAVQQESKSPLDPKGKLHMSSFFLISSGSGESEFHCREK